LSQRLLGCDLYGQKGIGILRAGEGADAQALLLRYGPALNHAHLDDLNINYFGRGYELTYDLGYDNASTHSVAGWSHRTASHNLVVVNETSQMKSQGSTGGSLYLFADLPTVRLIEASSEPSYAGQGVSLYRRTLALVTTGPHPYLVDMFRVHG